VCHHTGSWKHPYHLIHISTHALHAHLTNADVLPGANNSCPTTQPADAKTHGHGKGTGRDRAATETMARTRRAKRTTTSAPTRSVSRLGVHSPGPVSSRLSR
jgi:hypothetical protein